jgi:hypothetical protein
MFQEGVDKMIKKVLILMLVLGMASLASADYSLNFDGSRTLSVSWGPGDWVSGTQLDRYFSVVTDPGGIGVITGGSPTGAAPPDSAWFGDNALASGIANGHGDGMWGAITEIATGNTYAPGVYFDGIDIALSGAGLVYLVTTADFQIFTDTDSVMVPEPTTIALLSLGGLFLRRRISRA